MVRLTWPTIAASSFRRSTRISSLEAKLKPKPDWRPRYPGSGRLNPFGGQPPENIEDFGKDSPMGCPGQPNEVAPSFLFLACEDASYMTGQVLHPDGGESTSS